METHYGVKGVIDPSVPFTMISCPQYSIDRCEQARLLLQVSDPLWFRLGQVERMDEKEKAGNKAQIQLTFICSLSLSACTQR
jgi:hypothetical protein